MKNKTFYSHGKLLLSGEYVVLDGAISLAIPTKYGQYLIIEPIKEAKLYWKSFDETKNIWFEKAFKLNHGKLIIDEGESCNISSRLLQVINAAKALNPAFLNDELGFKVETHLEFPKNWGLGTSSTLINSIAEWANVDAYILLEKTFGGSGYDIACAQNNTPITYNLRPNNKLINQTGNKKRVVNEVNFNPLFKEQLYFVHLNKKQNSRDGIKHYHENKKNAQNAIKEINAITLGMIESKTLENFQELITLHENIISKITKQTPVKDLLFKDFNGAIKSLGAWGGDFIIVASNNNPVEYFKEKGFRTIMPYSSMILLTSPK